jgi:hypothetical protein
MVICLEHTRTTNPPPSKTTSKTTSNQRRDQFNWPNFPSMRTNLLFRYVLLLTILSGTIHGQEKYKVTGITVTIDFNQQQQTIQNINPHFPALQADALALSGASRRKQSPRSPSRSCH